MSPPHEPQAVRWVALMPNVWTWVPEAGPDGLFLLHQGQANITVIVYQDGSYVAMDGSPVLSKEAI